MRIGGTRPFRPTSTGLVPRAPSARPERGAAPADPSRRVPRRTRQLEQTLDAVASASFDRVDATNLGAKLAERLSALGLRLERVTVEPLAAGGLQITFE